MEEMSGVKREQTYIRDLCERGEEVKKREEERVSSDACGSRKLERGAQLSSERKIKELAGLGTVAE